MKLILNFKCESGEVIERYIDSHAKFADCHCGKPAVKTITAPKFLGNSTGGNASFKKKRV